jgi:hypothetical protein
VRIRQHVACAVRVPCASFHKRLRDSAPMLMMSTRTFMHLIVFKNIAAGTAGVSLLLSGCAKPSLDTSGTPGTPIGIEFRPVVSATTIVPGLEGRMLTSPHVRLMTTIADDEQVEPVFRTLNAVHGELSRLLLPTGERREPIEAVYVYSLNDWRRYIIVTTPADVAPIYLQLTRGGYAVGNRVAIRYLGSSATPAVASHEAVHAFIAAHFRSRPPPFLEEGFAATFENIRLLDDRAKSVRIDTTSHAHRQARLRTAHLNRELKPLSHWLASDAGNVVGDVTQVDLFYAQAWALIRWLRSEPALSADLDRLLADARLGKLPPLAAAAMLSHYLDLPPETIDADYMRFLDRFDQGPE